MNVGIRVSEARATALVQAGQPLPPLQGVRALVDTGASCTCVDPETLAALNLTPRDQVKAHTPSDREEPEVLDAYDVGFVIRSRAEDPPLIIPTLPVLASSLRNQGIHALIGRDILGHCVLVYNGRTQHFTLAF